MAADRPVRRVRLAALLGAQAVAPAGDTDGLAVTGLRAVRVREPVSRRSYTVLRVETRSGLTGFGECSAGALTEAELERLRALVLGKPSTAYEVVGRALAGLGAVEAAITMALLDVVGRHARAPVYQILGGPTRHKVRALTTLEGGSDADLLAALRRARAAGFRAFVVPLPARPARIQGDAFVQATRRRFETLAAEGRDLDFVVDGGGALSPADAARVASALEPCHPLWLDEPCPLSNLIRKIADETVTPLGLGKTVASAGAVQDLLREEVVDVLRPSLGRHSLTQVRRMAALAETSYVAVAPHHEGGPIATAAALHLAASLPNFVIQHIPPTPAADDRRMRDALVGTDLEAVRDGYAALPTGPGLGIAVDERVLATYQDQEPVR
jgi:galactonate dehydratase